MGGTGSINGQFNNGVTPTNLQQRSVNGLHHQYQMSYNGPPTAMSGMNSGMAMAAPLSFSKQGSIQDNGEKLTAFQRRQLEKKQTEHGVIASNGGQMSIEDRLARLKQIH